MQPITPATVGTRLSLARREALTFYLLISPWLLGLLLFVLGPMIASLFISFTRWDLLSPAKFVGLQNYEKMFTRDPLFWQSLKVTAIYTPGLCPDGAGRRAWSWPC